jgi:hypothetical protein
LVVAVSAAACSTAPPAKRAKILPAQILPAPAGLIAGGDPQANGTMWLVAGSATAKTLQEINLVSGTIEKIVPIGAKADSVVESPTGVLAVGYSAANGPVEFRSGTSGSLLHAVTVGAPVKAVASGSDGTTFFVLSGNSSETSVNTVSATGAAEPPSIGVSLSTIAVAVGTGDDQLYLLQSSGSVVVTPLGVPAGQTPASGSFFVGNDPHQLALSADGSLLFVLKGSESSPNIGIFNAATGQVRKVLPAPANSVDLVTAIDNAHIYVMIGTAAVGNIQVFPVGV